MKSGRAWNGKLSRIDKLIAWLYDEDILTKAEKAQKDRLFRRYYRWYNDGDIPRGMNSCGFSNASSMSKYMKLEIEERIETELIEFISKILRKYHGKYDRRTFHIDNALNKLGTLISICDHNDHNGLTTHWYKDIKDPNILSEIQELGKLGVKFKETLPEKLRNYTFSFAMENISDEDKTREILELSREIRIKMCQIGSRLREQRVLLMTEKDLHKLGK